MKMNIPELRRNTQIPHRLLKSFDNTILFVHEWSPDSSTNTAILILHGITAYSEPYSEIAELLMRTGYQVFGLDLRGHGLSDGNRGDYPSKKHLLSDLKVTIETFKSEYDNLIILGHSLGIVTGMEILNNFPDMIDGIIFLSGARQVRPGAYPKKSRLRTIKIILFSIIAPKKPVIKYYREGMVGLDDPLFNFKYSLRFLRVLDSRKMEMPEKIKIPLLFGLGDQDELFSVDDAKSFFEEFPAKEKEFFIIEGAKHAEFPETIKDSRLISWLQEFFLVN
ncbi:MAG: alpha/beta hydrolase [Candidatus Hodarchaeales archaeon]|jgi:alpha-beta hydrolase superfamily lysophospholipase